MASSSMSFVLKCNIRWCSDASDVRNVDKAHGLIWQTNLPQQKHILRLKRLEELHSVGQAKVSACPDVILWEGKQLPCKNIDVLWKKKEVNYFNGLMKNTKLAFKEVNLSLTLFRVDKVQNAPNKLPLSENFHISLLF